MGSRAGCHCNVLSCSSCARNGFQNLGVTEALRQRTPSTVDRIFSSEKLTVGFVRVVELFKGVKVPSAEPVNQSRPRPPATNIQEENAKPLCIDGHRALPLGQASYMLRSMPVPGEHVSTWQNMIRERLVGEVQKHFRTEICQLELIMVADAAFRVGPCIVLSVWDESLCHTEDGRRRTVKNANKIVRKFQTMQNCPFPIKPVADKLSLAARCSLLRPLPITCSDCRYGSQRPKHARRPRNQHGRWL